MLDQLHATQIVALSRAILMQLYPISLIFLLTSISLLFTEKDTSLLYFMKYINRKTRMKGSIVAKETTTMVSS